MLPQLTSYFKLIQNPAVVCTIELKLINWGKTLAFDWNIFRDWFILVIVVQNSAHNVVY
jgi:hypothetical protein